MVLLCKKTASFLEFPLCFCPEPVLVERSFLSKGRRGMYHNHKSGQKHRFLTSHTTAAALLLVPSDGCTRKVGTSWCGFMSTYLRMDHGHDACQSARAGWPVLRVASHGGLGEGGTAGRQDSRQQPSLTETAERGLQCSHSGVLTTPKTSPEPRSSELGPRRADASTKECGRSSSPSVHRTFWVLLLLVRPHTVSAAARAAAIATGDSRGKRVSWHGGCSLLASLPTICARAAAQQAVPAAPASAARRVIPYIY
jgi:hypothetical protein